MKQLIKNSVGLITVFLVVLGIAIASPVLLILTWIDEGKYPAKMNFWPWQYWFWK